MSRRILAGQRPRLRLVRAERDARPWYDAPAVGVAIVVSLLVGVVLACAGMGWVRP